MKFLIKITFLFLAGSYQAFSQLAVFTASKEQDCNILKVTFDGSASTGTAPLHYYWDFGNGNTISGTDKAIVEAIYVQEGTPEVTFYVVDAKGIKSNVASKQLRILSGPKIDFTASTLTVCSGKPVQFINNTKEGSSPITGYIWNIGSNVSFRTPSPTYTFGSLGSYDVTLIATDANGCNVSLKKEGLVKVQNDFAVSFQADSVFTCSTPFPIPFKDRTDYSKVSGHTFSYLWSFGDGTTSAEQYPVKNYTSTGRFSVELALTDLTNGCIASKNVANYITVGAPKPRSIASLQNRKCTDFVYSVNPNNNGLPSRFVNTVDLGDGTSYIVPTNQDAFTHTYTKSGTYLLKTTFSDPNAPNCSQTGYDTLVVPFLNEEMVADQTHACEVPMKVNFSTKNIVDGLFYEWDFGDGTFSKESTPVKTYFQKGVYDVRLKVWSTSGCVYQLEKKALITAGKMQLAFSSDANRVQEFPREFDTHPLDSSLLQGGCLPFAIQFDNQSNLGPGTLYSWDFGDGQTSLSPSSVRHTYTQEGIFSPILIAMDSSGCKDSLVCKSCVRVGAPPKAGITQIGPDTVCCLYDKTFAANVDLDDVDLLWYNIDLDDGNSTGLTQSYYKNDQGNWILEDNTTTIYPFDPPGQGIRFSQTNFALANGNYPDFYFYAYKNGCPTKIEYPNYQKHVLPWGTFAPIPCEQEENLKGGDTLDFNKIGGDWILGIDRDGNDMKLSRAVIKFEYSGSNGCTMPVYTETYTAASLGFELTAGAFQKIKEAGLFPKIVLPACAAKGDELLSTTYLYTHDDAKKTYEQGKCLCEEHWPYKIGSPSMPSYTVSNGRGCAPLTSVFKSGASSIQWVFEDGTIISGTETERTFERPGIYRFKVSTTTCSPNRWTDSIEVHGLPVAHFSPNQALFCLNSDPVNNSNKTLELTDSSYSKTDTIKKWVWDFGNGASFSKTNSEKVSYVYAEKDIPTDPSKATFVRLKVTDQHGCEGQDSVKVLLRGTKPAYLINIFSGCYDTLKALPLYPQMGAFAPYSGKLTVYFTTGTSSTPILEYPLASLASETILLPKNGTYTVRMAINSDALGTCRSETDTSVKVQYSGLSPDFKILSKTKFSCVPAMVQTVDASTQTNRTIETWNWRFVNLATKTELKGSGAIPTSFALTDTGYYDVSLTVVDTKGCRKTILKDSAIYINELYGRIDSISPPLCPGELAYFRGSSTNADNYFWDFGDGSVVSGLEARHSYNTVGERNISFIVTDSSNCRKSYSGKVTMKPAPSFELGNDTVVCEGQNLALQGPSRPNYVYAWNTGDNTPILDITKGGFYRLTVKDTLLNCPFTDSIHVRLSTPPSVDILPIAPVCKGETIHLQGNTDSTAVKVNWITNNQVIGTTRNISFIAQESSILLEAFNKDRCRNQSTRLLPILERPSLFLGHLDICPGDSARFIPSVPIKHSSFSYQWSVNGQNIDTTATLLVRNPGVYTLSYGKTNCRVSASARLGFHPLPDPSTNPSTVILCEENSEIEIDGGLAAHHVWLPNEETHRFLKIDKVGKYVVKISNEFRCELYDTIRVENRCPPQLYVPTAFTPEQVGENQVHTIFGYNIGAFELRVYNRWGEVIYHTHDIHQPWNGYYKGELMPSGVYPWIIRYSGNNPDHTNTLQMEGKVVVVR